MTERDHNSRATHRNRPQAPLLEVGCSEAVDFTRVPTRPESAGSGHFADSNGLEPGLFAASLQCFQNVGLGYDAF